MRKIVRRNAAGIAGERKPERGSKKSVHRMEKARHPMERYKTSKTNEIWLLGAKSKSGTLDSADVLWEVIWAGLIHGLIRT